MENSILAFIDDLFFQVKVAETAKQIGITVEFSESNLPSRPDRILVDLGYSKEEIAALIHRIRKQWPAAEITAFGPHVDGGSFELAREAGADQVLPRSKFSSNLPEILGTDR
jgi:hypothetical protein